MFSKISISVVLFFAFITHSHAEPLFYKEFPIYPPEAIKTIPIETPPLISLPLRSREKSLKIITDKGEEKLTLDECSEVMKEFHEAKSYIFENAEEAGWECFDTGYIMADGGSKVYSCIKIMNQNKIYVEFTIFAQGIICTEENELSWVSKSVDWGTIWYEFGETK
jgi:hypothetical protein